MNEKFLKAINNQTWWDETITTTKGNLILFWFIALACGFSVCTIINVLLNK